MKYIIFASVFSILLFAGCSSQPDAKSFSINELVFSSVFSNRKNDSLHTYCVLGAGYFRTPTSKNADSILNDWLVKHPNAIVVPVSTHGPVLIKQSDSKMTFCWIIDKGDTLNNYLIRTGCYPGGTMERPKTREEMTSEDKRYLQGGFKVDVHVDKAAYERFIGQIKSAESFAIEHHLGIWNKNDEEEE